MHWLAVFHFSFRVRTYRMLKTFSEFFFKKDYGRADLSSVAG